MCQPVLVHSNILRAFHKVGDANHSSTHRWHESIGNARRREIIVPDLGKKEFVCKKQCRDRYDSSLRPDGKKGQWTEEEDENIIRLHAEFGNKWSKVFSCG